MMICINKMPYVLLNKPTTEGTGYPEILILKNFHSNNDKLYNKFMNFYMLTQLHQRCFLKFEFKKISLKTR